jgi:flagellar basal body-associated protein FliL
LDNLNKELEYNVEELHQANKDLDAAAKISGKSNKCMLITLLLLFLIVGGACVTFLIL